MADRTVKIICAGGIGRQAQVILPDGSDLCKIARVGAIQVDIEAGKMVKAHITILRADVEVDVPAIGMEDLSLEGGG